MPLKTRKLLRILSRYYAYKEIRKGGGSHSIWRNRDGHTIVIPMKETIKRGTYLAILRQAKIDRKDFESHF